MAAPPEIQKIAQSPRGHFKFFPAKFITAFVLSSLTWSEALQAFPVFTGAGRGAGLLDAKSES
jgi:hypothetical protein